MSRRICLLAGRFDTTLLVSNGLAAWSRVHRPWRIEVLSQADPQNIGWLGQGYLGVIAVEPAPAMQRALAQLGCPVIAIGGDASIIPTVTLDDAAIGRAGAEHLLSIGRRQLAYYGLPGPWSLQRFRGFEQTLREKGIDFTTNQRDGHWPTWNDSQNEQEVRRFLQSLRTPTSIMACCDMLARVLADTCGEMGLQVPEDVAIVGVDNAESLCESDRMTITSVDTALEHAGQEAGRLLELRISGKTVPQLTTIPPRSVVQRRSTDPSALSDPEIGAAVRFIKEHACEGIGVEDVCRHVAISRRQLERRFVAQLGRPPGDEIRTVRIARARELLALTNLSLTQIAIRCGYEHLSSFSAAFRDQTGLAPSQYRLAHAGS